MKIVPPVIRYEGGVITMTLPRIAAMLREGLTIAGYQMLALAADYHEMMVEQLCAAALASEVGR